MVYLPRLVVTRCSYSLAGSLWPLRGPPARGVRILSFIRKLVTAARLLVRGDHAIFIRELRLAWRRRRLRPGSQRPFVHRTAGFPFVCFPELADSVYHYLHGGDDAWEIALLRRWLEPGDVFLDAGANLGLYAHAAAAFFSGRVRVLAIEASPELVGRLETAARLLGEQNLHAIHAAVGATEGEVTFYIARPGRTTVVQSMQISAEESANYEPRQVPMRTLGGIAAQHAPDGRIAVVKVDIEGAEPLALRGSPRCWLDASGPLWLVELHSAALRRLDSTFADVLSHFSPAMFEMWIVPKYPFGDQPARPRRLAAGETFTDAPFYNLVALPLGPWAEQRRQRLKTLFA